MAPNGHTPLETRRSDRSAQDNFCPTWLKDHGSMEFKEWQKANPGQPLSYEDWQKTQNLEGLSLYYAALKIWDESDSSNDEVAEDKVERRPRGVRAPSAREPKKTLKSNGTGLARPSGSATPSAMVQVEELSPSAKKKRKARKKYLEIVASEESEDATEATPITEVTTPSAPAITVNGRRKSSNRKPRKKPISEETISPEDEEDDPMAAINGITTPAIASPLPVRSAPKASSAVQHSEPPKKTILKLSTRRAPKKKVLSEETVLDDDTDDGRAAATTVASNFTAITNPNIVAAAESHTPRAVTTAANSNEATASPEPTSEAAAATRRGLRTRRPAQQKPYSYDAQIFEENDDIVSEEDATVQLSPTMLDRRVSVASLGKSYAEDQVPNLDEETLAILQSADAINPEQEDDYGRPKHFKGKGRAWKKEESDEDLEFNPSKKKAAKAKAKAKALAQQQPHQPKKRGRPKKIVLSEDVVRDDSDDDVAARTDDVSPSPSVWEASTKKAKKPPRKSNLSEAIVRDETDDEVHEEKSEQATANGFTSEVSTPIAKKPGRPRKSDQSAESKTPAGPSEKNDDDVSHTPKDTPSKPHTPKDEPMSHTPKSEPKQISLSVNDIASIDMDVGDSLDPANDSNPVIVSPSTIEAHTTGADVNDDGKDSREQLVE